MKAAGLLLLLHSLCVLLGEPRGPLSRADQPAFPGLGQGR